MFANISTLLKLHPSKTTKLQPMAEQKQSTQHDSLLTCGNGGIFLQFDLPNSLVEYNKMLGSRPRDTHNMD